MSIVVTTENITLFQGLPFRHKFLVVDTDTRLVSFDKGYITGTLGTLHLTQASGYIEVQPRDGEVVIDLPETVTTLLSTGVVAFSLSWYDGITSTLIVSGTATIAKRSDVVGGSGTPWEPVIKIGTLTDYSEFEADGSLHAVGDATMYRDLLQGLIGQTLANPGGRINLDYSEGSLEFASNTVLTDYVVMPIQINHDWLLGSDIEPHIHWWQTSSDVPNWLIQYRWQIQGDEKTTAWTSAAWDSNAFTYNSETALNQITGFPDITPPVGYGEVSDILQIRLLRDTGNASGLFGGADPIAAAVQAVNFDIHYEVDTIGSRELYSK